MIGASSLDLPQLTRREGESAGVSVLIASKHPQRGAALQEQVLQLPQMASVHCACGQEDAVEMTQKLRPDVLILDVAGEEAPVACLGTQLGYRAALIYVVSDDAAAMHAFDAGAIDCIRHPVQLERLRRALQRAITWNAGSRGDDIERMVLPSEIGGAAEWLRFLRMDDALQVARLDDVVYLQADRKLTRVFLQNAEGYVRMGINAVATRLDKRQFWRIHRGIIVNGRFVSAIQQDSIGRVTVQLRDRPQQLTASRVHERALMRDGLF